MAQSPTGGSFGAGPDPTPKSVRTPTQHKLSSELIRLSKTPPRITQTPAPHVTQTPVDAARHTPTGQVSVDVRGTVSPDLVADIERRGGRVIASSAPDQLIQAVVPVLAVEALAARPDVTAIVESAMPRTNVGAVTTEGDIAHGAKATRMKYAVDGRGVKVCVMSDNVKYLGESQRAGELSNIKVLDAGPDLDESDSPLPCRASSFPMLFRSRSEAG
jgi:hypothetical protein